MNKKDEELKFSKFFIERFNQRYGLNYRVISNNKETKTDGDIDVYALGESGQKLNLQVTTGEGELKQFRASIRKESRQTGKNVSGTTIIGHTGRITQPLRQKEQKYPIGAKNNLILLVTEGFGPQYDKEYVQRVFGDYDTAFKGIYLIKYPSDLDAIDGHSCEGQIVAIKDIFGNHGKIF